MGFWVNRWPLGSFRPRSLDWGTLGCIGLYESVSDIEMLNPVGGATVTVMLPSCPWPPSYRQELLCYVVRIGHRPVEIFLFFGDHKFCIVHRYPLNTFHLTGELNMAVIGLISLWEGKWGCGGMAKVAGMCPEVACSFASFLCAKNTPSSWICIQVYHAGVLGAEHFALDCLRLQNLFHLDGSIEIQDCAVWLKAGDGWSVEIYSWIFLHRFDNIGHFIVGILTWLL